MSQLLMHTYAVPSIACLDSTGLFADGTISLKNPRIELKPCVMAVLKNIISNKLPSSVPFV